MSGSIKPEVSVILVNYNGRPWLPGCLGSLQRQTQRNFEVILVDNHSSDDSLAYVRRVHREVRILSQTTNLGFAGGNNIGLAAAQGDYIVLLNTDTYLTPTCLADLQAAFKHIPRLGCVQPKLIFMHEPDKLDSCGSYFTVSGFLDHIGNQRSVTDLAYLRPRPVLSIKGACMMFPRALLEHTNGLFDATFWCYFEETDFCWRVWLAGYECWYYPQAALYHATGGTTGHHLTQATAHYHSLKNRLSTYLQNLSPLYLWKTLSIHLAANLALSLLLLPVRPRISVALWRAFAYWIVHLPACWRRRHVVQTQLRRLPDHAWLPRVTSRLRVSRVLRQLLGLVTYERYKYQPITLED